MYSPVVSRICLIFEFHFSATAVIGNALSTGAGQILSTSNDSYPSWCKVYRLILILFKSKVLWIMLSPERKENLQVQPRTKIDYWKSKTSKILNLLRTCLWWQPKTSKTPENCIRKTWPSKTCSQQIQTLPPQMNSVLHKKKLTNTGYTTQKIGLCCFESWSTDLPHTLWKCST